MLLWNSYETIPWLNMTNTKISIKNIPHPKECGMAGKQAVHYLLLCCLLYRRFLFDLLRSLDLDLFGFGDRRSRYRYLKYPVYESRFHLVAFYPLGKRKPPLKRTVGKLMVDIVFILHVLFRFPFTLDYKLP